MVFEAGLLGGPATATTLHPSSQTLIEEDPVSEKDSDKDGDAAENPASDPMVLEAGLQPSTEHAPTQEDTTGATDNIDTESAPATLHATPSTATPAASQEGDGGLPSEDGAECTPNFVGTACPTPDAVQATPVPTAGISSARMAPAPDSSGAQSPAPAIPDAPVAASPTDATPTSSVAARRLEKFAEAVQVKRPSPIIAEPPRQKPAAKRPTVPHRNSRIAAQEMGHNPASKRGEVLLMKKMGVQPPNAPVSSAAKRSYESIFKGNMSLTQAAAFDELFPAVQI